MEQLETSGLTGRTVVIFLSDNGGDRSERVGFTSLRDKSGPVGSSRSFTAYGTGWANASNTPYRWFKSTMYHGGIASPFIVHWPEELPVGDIRHTPAHVTDLMATCLELAGATYPDTFKGRSIFPTDGISLLPLLRGEAFPAGRSLYWEHIGSRAMRQGDWKIVAQRNDTTWTLYNVAEDPAELRDLAEANAERLQSMVADYEAWAQRVGIIDRKTLQAYRNAKPKLPVEEVLGLYQRDE
jgi:arylsulfatase